jgi:hypothetical protein
VNTVATIGKVGWCHDIVGDGHGSEADWARACNALRPWWVNGTVEAISAHRRHGGSDRYSWEWGNTLDYTQELGG